MKKIYLVCLFFIALLILGCTKSDEQPQQVDANTETVTNNIEKEILIEITTTTSTSTSTSSTTQQIIINKINNFLVSRVIDGDTIELTNGQKVRLICIDTPETNEPYYLEAKQYLSNLILNKEVSLEKDVSETDRYGRLLRYVYFDNELINNKLVIEGYAKVYRYPPDTKYCNEFEKSENIAKNSNLGLWSQVEQTNTQPSSSDTNSQYTCSSNTYNCGDFKTHSEAQKVFDLCGGVNNDIHQLDKDGDGIACESLP